MHQLVWRTTFEQISFRAACTAAIVQAAVELINGRFYQGSYAAIENCLNLSGLQPYEYSSKNKKDLAGYA
jgi:hypothetical protein